MGEVLKDSSDESRRTQQGLDVKYLLCMQHKLKLPVSPLIYHRSTTVEENGLSFICILRPVNPRFSRFTDDTILISTLSHAPISLSFCLTHTTWEINYSTPSDQKEWSFSNVSLTGKRFIMLISRWHQWQSKLKKKNFILRNWILMINLKMIFKCRKVKYWDQLDSIKGDWC